MRIATIQMAMKWRSEANVATILATNEYVAKIGCDIVIYPELTITGYHREVRKETQKALHNPQLLRDVAASARQHKLYVWVGVPVSQSGNIYNSYQCYDPDGQLLGEIYKNGLTSTEQTLFACGTDRPSFQLGSLSASVFLCRESADLPILKSQLGANPPDILFWPGYIGNQSPPDPNNPEGTVEQAQAVANSLAAHVIQSNWANALNSPDQKDLGGSIVTDRNGELIGRCPDAKPGIGIVDLSTGQFCWDSTYF